MTHFHVRITFLIPLEWRHQPKDPCKRIEQHQTHVLH